MIEGAVILLAGAIAGWIARGVRRHPTTAASTAATCACEHVRSMHVEGKGACQEKVYLSGSGWNRCRCQLYQGPEPLPAYYAPEVEG